MLFRSIHKTPIKNNRHFNFILLSYLFRLKLKAPVANMVTRCRDDALLRSLILIGCHIVCNIGCFVHNLSSFFVSLETFLFTFREIFVTAVEDSSVITVLGSGLLEMLYRMKMEESKKQDQSYSQCACGHFYQCCMEQTIKYKHFIGGKTMSAKEEEYLSRFQENR